MTFEEILPYLRKEKKELRRGNSLRLVFIENALHSSTKSHGYRHYSLDYEDLTADDWEIYEEPIDWNYIIENKCLCWFWDDDKDTEIKRIATFLYKKSEANFIDTAGYCWKRCCPVCRDEITFYEENKR